MNTLIRRTILFLGLVVAALILADNFSYADTNKNLIGSTLDQETELLAVNILKTMDQEENKDAVYKVFNKTDQLVYECRNNKDEKLTQLLKSSDFITEINKVTYYKLSR